MLFDKVYASSTTYVSGFYYSQNFGNSMILLTGHYIPCHRYGQKRLSQMDSLVSCRSLLKFEDISSLPNDKAITRAILYIYVCRKGGNNGYDCGSLSQLVSLHNNLDDFNTNTVTWEEKPPVSGTAAAMMNIKDKDVGCYVGIDVTSLVLNWKRGILPNYGITLISNDSSVNNLIGYHSINNEYPPYIHIQYCSKGMDDTCCGNRIPKYIENSFKEMIFNINDRGSFFNTSNIGVSKSREITFFIQNNGENNIEAYLQISPDGINFVDSPQIMQLKKGEMTMITPYMFSKYIRVAIRSSDETAYTQVKIWYQSQLLSYQIEYTKID